MATDNPQWLFDLAERLQTAVVAEFADQDEPVALPDRQFITFGDVAHDCEQFVVQVERVRAGLTGSSELGPINCVVSRSAEIALHVVRCVPTLQEGGEAPTAEALTDSAQEMLTDAWLLSEAVVRRRHEYAAPEGLRMDVSVGEVATVGPSGALAAVIQRVTVQV